MIRLFTTWYQSGSAARQAELEECLQRNLVNPHLGQICLWQDSGENLPPHPKLLVRREKSPPEFDDFFAWANAVCPPGEVAIIANNDIWFDDTIRLAETVTANQVFALLRWESDGQLLQDDKGRLRWDSQDTWIFQTPIRDIGARHCLGKPRTENALAYRLWRLGYDLRNPAKSIHSHHHHASQVRNPHFVAARIPPPWLHLEPLEIHGQPRYKILRKTFNPKWAFVKLKNRLTSKARPPR